MVRTEAVLLKSSMLRLTLGRKWFKEGNYIMLYVCPTRVIDEIPGFPEGDLVIRYGGRGTEIMIYGEKTLSSIYFDRLENLFGKNYNDFDRTADTDSKTSRSS